VKKLWIILLFLLSLKNARAQYWQQQTDYLIDVTLHPGTKSLDGFEKITYTNNSPDTLHFIWFHLWPNAYKNDRTALSDQMLQQENTALYFASREQRGYINRLQFKVNGTLAATEDHPEHIDIIKVLLPQPLPPGGVALVTTPFHVKLPQNVSRSGYEGNAFQLTQWYPKPAVYDRKGWHPMPYLDQGEFYSEFGSFDVRITVPQSYVVAATGVLQNEEEKEWMRTRKVPVAGSRNLPAARKGGNVSVIGGRQAAKAAPADTAVSEPTKTLRFVQDRVHDFALFANPQFMVTSDTCVLPTGRVVNVHAFYTENLRTAWKNSLQYAKDALRFYSAAVGPYPYDVLSIVSGPPAFYGGMEYPTITVISPEFDEQSLDEVIAHEVGHNWFYGILGSHERRHPWMDEGLNTYYEYQYTKSKYGPQNQWQELLLRTQVARKKDQPVETAADAFADINYGVVAYHKTANWLSHIERTIGTEAFRRAMQNYYSQWQFRHPYPEDLQAAFRAVAPAQTDSLFALLHQRGNIGPGERRSWRITTPLGLGAYLKDPSKQLLLLSPAIGRNRYDGFMLGGAITNIRLPPSPLQFFIAPLYAFNSAALRGAAHVNYTIYPLQGPDRIRISLGALHFARRESRDSMGGKQFETFTRLTPALQVSLKEPVQSSRSRNITLKSFLIREQLFDRFVVKSTDSLVYVDSSVREDRYINQLSYTEENNRALYPYDYSIELQQGASFYRLNVNGNYFFNYAKGGGLSVRVFAAKFGHINRDKNRFGNFRYMPKLLGITGDEDYTYSNYFTGRTASAANADDAVVGNKGIDAHQVMIRDGGFKLRFDQYSFLQGRSDNWVAAANFSTTLPRSLLPLPIPLKLFMDVGTYADAWDATATGSRFLFVGGLQLSLAEGLVNIYAPLVYSNEFREYINLDGMGFFRRMTFSIDIHRFSLRRFSQNRIVL